MTRWYLALPLAATLACSGDAAPAADAAADTAGAAAPPAAVAPATIGLWAGQLPCADCAGIRTELTLLADGSFRLKETYLGTKDGDRTTESTGQYVTMNGMPGDSTAQVYHLNPLAPAATRYFKALGDTAVVMLDQMMRPIESRLNYTLRRVS